ncbi:MAG: hypothetical protein U5L76_05685 [Patescibacteria group bacterium]|nr:hypothetical protein [Patescibacteria group bacterium]
MSTKIEKAKATLNGALIGLVLTLGAFVLLDLARPWSALNFCP